MKTILLSPEQINDCQDTPWLREATPEEAQAFKDEHPCLPAVDREMRPYFPMTIDETHPEFPPHLKEQIERALRVFRFWEKPQ
jgi:hypothetical protein